MPGVYRTCRPPIPSPSPTSKASIAPDRAWQIELERSRPLGTSGRVPRPGSARLGRTRSPGPPRGHGPDAASRTSRRHPAAPGSRRMWPASTTACPAAPTAPPSSTRPGSPPAVGALDTARHLARHPPPLRRLPHQALARAGRPPPRRRAVDLFATDGPGTAGSNGWLDPRQPTATGAPIIAGDPHRYIEAPASTSRSAWPARSSTCSGSPCRGSRASRTSATRARSPGRSPTRWPTTRTSTPNSSGVPATETGRGARPGRVWHPARRPHRDLRGRRRRRRSRSR